MSDNQRNSNDSSFRMIYSSRRTLKRAHGEWARHTLAIVWYLRIPLQEFWTNTVVSRYFDTAGIRKQYHYIQTIEISSINFYCFVMVGILIWYHSKQHFELSDIVIMRDYCTCNIESARLSRPVAVGGGIKGVISAPPPPPNPTRSQDYPWIIIKSPPKKVWPWACCRSL